MATGDQKLRILYLNKIFFETTDENHGITMHEIIQRLKEYGITCDRKTIYSDLDAFERFGTAIEPEQKENTVYYKLVERDFELAELKLLVDSLQSAKFISRKKSEMLIKKLERLTSEHQAGELNRQVIVAGRAKSENEKLLYSVDAIHNAIAKDVKINFKYFNYNEKKEKVYHDDGQIKTVSPWAVTLSEENYYLIAYDSAALKLKTYRIDKMDECTITKEQREGKKVFAELDIAEYSKERIRMYSGEVKTVTLKCKNDYAAVVIDRFGKDIIMKKEDDEHFITKLKVAVSSQFIAWVLSMNQGMEIVAPDEVVEEVKRKVAEVRKTYNC